MIDLIKIMEEKARIKPAKIVICEGWDERCLRATDNILKNKLANIVLLGNPADIKNKAKELNLDIKNAEIVDFKNDKKLKKELAEKLVEVRKHKGMTIEEANKLIEDENYFGCMYAYCKYADAVAGSAICPTAALMKPALQILREKDKLVSETAFMGDVKNKRKLIISDTSLNISPTAQELAQVGLNAIDSARMFDISPRVAFVSYSTKGSGGNGPDLMLIREAVKITQEKDKKAIVDGEMQIDAAVNPKSAQKKCPDSILKGDANILIFPNLMSSNLFVHGIGQFSDMTFDFTVLKGLIKPVAILGRSMPVEGIRNMIVGCAMQVNSK
jgi:phosphate acetyltransferase